MDNINKIPCLILARGGSKGIEKKNIKNLLGRPLIGWIIDSAKKSDLIGEIYVSTDCKEIADVSYEYGANVISRPEYLAGDQSKDIESFMHALSYIPDCGEIVHLRATTPTISSEILDDAIRYYLSEKTSCTSMRSVHQMTESIFKFYKIIDDKYLDCFMGASYQDMGRQYVPKTFVPNGYIDIVKTDIIRKGSMYGDRILSYVTEEVIEIDTIGDFEYLEYKLKREEK